MLDSNPIRGRRAVLRRLALLLSLFVALLLLSPSPAALAQDSDATGTLLPGETHQFRFDYKGDRTQIDIVVEASEGITFDVFAPDQPAAIGSGARGGNELHWSGRSRTAGAYRIEVKNPTPGPIIYSLAVLGESVSAVGQILPDRPPPNAEVTTEGGRMTLNVSLPTGARRLTSPVVPSECTPPSALPAVVTTSVKLCPNQIYAPFRVAASGVGVFGDAAQSAVISSAGRQFALVMDGSGNWVDGVVIQSAPDAADDGAFLCQYDECTFPTQPTPTILRGGLAYGGGMLLLGSHNVVHDVTARGGTIGIASVDGVNNVLVGNNLSDLNGWGSFNLRSHNSVFVGNRFDRDNHGCTTPDGRVFEHGCETAGWVCLQCANNLVAQNHCEASGNCYYMSGERGLGSNNNRFVGNYCAASPNNCFEFTFSEGNVLQDNIATAHPATGAACKYPFWIGGSTVYFGQNEWGCTISPQDSLADAVKSTDVPTVALALGGNPAPPFVQAQSPTRAPSTRAAPTATAAPTPARACNRNYRVRLLFDWRKLADWVDCVMHPQLP